MKQYTLSQFDATISLDGEKLTVTVAGKTVKKVKGEYVLKCVSDEANNEDFAPVVGTNYKFNEAGLIEGGEGLWVEQAPNEVTQETPANNVVEKTEAEITAEANQLKLKELNKAMLAAEKHLRDNITDVANLSTNAQALADAKLAYETFKASIGGGKTKATKTPKTETPKTPEEIASLGVIETARGVVATAKTAYDDAKTALEAAITAHKEAGFKIGSSKGTGNKGGGGERKITLEIAQNMRKRYSELTGERKARVTAICTEFGVDAVMVNRIIDYRQHLISKKDTMYIPFNPEFHNAYLGEAKAVTGSKWYVKIGK
jgi:hypothetical protein